MSRFIFRAISTAFINFSRNRGTHVRVPDDKPVVFNFYVNANLSTQMRYMIMRSCGDLLTYMRVVPVRHASKMRVWLCISHPASAGVLQAALRTMPGVEFPDVPAF